MAQRHPLNKPIAITMALFHLGAFAAPFFFSWRLFLLFIVMWCVMGISITLCYHRHLTHLGFKTYLWFKYVIATTAQLALQGDPIKWVGQHRPHHKYAEIPGKDPHTPRDGGWWSHMDWMLHPDPIFQDRVYLRKWASDLNEHAYFRWLENFTWVPILTLGLIFLWLGGVPAVLWGIATPVVVCWQATWLVNSGTHMWGSKRYNKGHDAKNDSRNNLGIALVTFGEGWHNNHHHAPTSARHGITWYEIDITWEIIRVLRLARLVWDVKEAEL